MNKWQISTIILGMLVVGLALISVKAVSFNGNSLSFLTEKTLSPEDATSIGLDYINKYLTDQGNPASIKEISKEAPKSFYKFTIEIPTQSFETPIYVSTDGKLLFPGEALNLEEVPSWAQEQQNQGEESQLWAETQQSESAEGNFTKLTNEEICKENGKPIVYFFGSTSCPHCIWEHPVLEEVVQEFGDYISFHNNMDSQNDMDIFSKYSSGSIPTLVLGCKYYRVGSGENDGEEKEKTTLTKLFCDLTQNQPASICNK